MAAALVTSCALLVAITAVPLVPAQSGAPLAVGVDTVATGTALGPQAGVVLETLLERSGEAAARTQREGHRSLWRALRQESTDAARPHPATRRADDPSLSHLALSLTVPAPVSQRGPPARSFS